MKWISVEDKLPPQGGKFIFSYEYGMGLGEWNQCYTERNGNSERTHKAYICILWPSDIMDGKDPLLFTEGYIKEFNLSWMPLPEVPEELD